MTTLSSAFISLCRELCGWSHDGILFRGLAQLGRTVLTIVDLSHEAETPSVGPYSKSVEGPQ
jgi:hypothetical protein